MDSGKCKHHSDFFSFFFRFFRNGTCICGVFSIQPFLPGHLNPRETKFKDSRLSGAATGLRCGNPSMKERPPAVPGKREALKKNPGPAKGPGRKYRIELSRITFCT